MILAASSLVVLAVVLSRLFRLDVDRQIVVAASRASVQLLAVGFLFAAIFTSRWALWWAWAWVAVMVAVATQVVSRRARWRMPWLETVAGGAVAASVAVSVGVMFGFGVLEFDPVSLVVVAGITIGNAMPSAVLGLNQAVDLARDRPGEVEAALALGFDRTQVSRFLAPRAARSSLIPQIERTKVVGLIALPGAMTGLLLAGVDPLAAVVIQLLVMLLVLGSTAMCVISVVALATRAAVTDDLRLASWVQERGEP